MSQVTQERFHELEVKGRVPPGCLEGCQQCNGLAVKAGRAASGMVPVQARVLLSQCVVCLRVL